MRRYVYIWQFEVAPENQGEFLHHYGPDGTWAQLFRRTPGYLETLMLQDERSPTRYLTVDRWASREAHDAFLQAHRAEYEQVDRLCESLTMAETSLGSFWEAAPPALAPSHASGGERPGS